MTSTPVSLILSLGICSAVGEGEPVPADSLRDLYAEAAPLEAFLEEDNERRALWDEHQALARLDEASRQRAAAVPGPWYLLAVTQPTCSDSIGSLPYLALLAQDVPGIEFRVVDAERGDFVLDRHRAPDGRKATPTVLLLDADHELAGCWVERPPALEAWWAEHDRPDAPVDERVRIKLGWYEGDRGREVLDLTLDVLEAAGQGRMVCPGASPPA